MTIDKCAKNLDQQERERDYRETTHISCGDITWAKFGLLRCYYLGQVCFFSKTLFVKNIIKIGVSALKKIARANLRCYYLGQVGHF